MLPFQMVTELTNVWKAKFDILPGKHEEPSELKKTINGLKMLITGSSVQKMLHISREWPTSLKCLKLGMNSLKH